MQPILVVLHTVVKDTVTAMTSSITDKFLKIIGRILMYIGLLLLGVMFITPFVIFRTCLHFTLKIFYGKLYGGLLNGSDLMFAINSDKTVTNILIFYSCSRKRFEREALIKSFIEKVHSSTDKFRCSIKKIFGYLYFIKDQIKSHEVLKMVDYNTAYITKNELHDYIEKNCLTISANQMWKVAAFSQPICNDVTNDSESPQYVIVITVVHCVGDGPAVASVFKKVLEEDLSKSPDLPIRKHIRHSRPSLNLSDAFIYRNPLTSELNNLELKIANNFNWHVVTHIETNPKYISIVREIKRKLGVNFMDVIGAAIYSSINDYIMTASSYYVIRRMGSLTIL
ncbi:hypothetical protein QE152_g37292 [Popillia japonica]|uniref:Uncharacterized protein n=1 Tax=Popillia japonica TaxID=7064 RepID=A0AAW1IB24_POPJA